jgi:hypothetical protein
MDEVVVNDNVGFLQAPEAARGNEIGRAGTGSDQVHNRSQHPAILLRVE